MPAAGGGRRILVLTNGHGEDAIGAELVRRLPQEITAEAYPTIGSGAAYEGLCAIVGPRASLPSEGSRVNEGSLSADLKAGAIARLGSGLRFLAGVRGKYDAVVVIGDALGVLACWLTGHREILYVDVYKTAFGRSYSAPERWLIGQTARRVFCRSAALAEALRKSGVDAACHGNIMADTVPRTGFEAGPYRSRARAVTLLPGSRGDAPGNLALFVSALETLPEGAMPDLFLALAGGLAPETLGAASGLQFIDDGDGGDRVGRLTGRGLDIMLVRGRALGDLLDASDAALALSGTAAIQAMGLGVPVIGFRGPRERQSRFAAEGALFGPARIVTEAEPVALGSALGALLADDADRARRGAFGRERVGGTGTLAALLAELDQLRSARASTSA